MERKKNYVSTFTNLTESYKKVIICEASNVGSTQMQEIRKQIRGKAVLMMGKNTMMKKAIAGHKSVNPKLAHLLPLLKGNIGLVFTNGDLREVRDIVNSNRQAAPAKAGQTSSKIVVIPAQNTGMEPTKTSFFQALNISTKISKGTVEIVSDSKILDVGQKVTQSEAALLNLLNMKPFAYGLVCKTIYDDGTVYSPDVLDTSAEDMMKVLQEGLTNIGSISMEVNYPTSVSIASQISAGFKNLLAISINPNKSRNSSRIHPNSLLQRLKRRKKRRKSKLKRRKKRRRSQNLNRKKMVTWE
jgi:large subunit ribosomal protein LP0